QPVRVGGEQQLAEGNQLQRLANQRPAERAGVVYGQAEIHEDMAEDLREVRGMAVERIVVQQQYRHPLLFGGSQERGQSQRVRTQQIDVGVAIADVDL